MIKKVKAPIRIDFAGGTTDIYPFTKIGGAVLNAAINRCIIGKLTATEKKVSLNYSGNIPTSSGLGTSGVMNLVWLSLISGTKDKVELAEKVYKLERAMGIIGGKQDQYTSALGGINFLEFKDDKVKIHKLKLNENLIKELESKLVLVYTGKPHLATKSNKFIIDELKKGKNIDSLKRIRNIAIKMKDALMKKDLEKFSELMNEETTERKKLHKSILTPRMSSIIKTGMKNGAVAAKICGAGGGGSILFFSDNRKKLKEKFKGRVIDFKFDFKGLRWV